MARDNTISDLRDDLEKGKDRVREKTASPTGKEDHPVPVRGEEVSAQAVAADGESACAGCGPHVIVPNVKYFFRNVYADYYMDVPGQRSENQPMQIYTFNGSLAQQFFIIMESGSNEFFAIQSVPTGKVLDVYQGKAVENNPVWQFERNGSNAQYFKLKRHDDGTVSFLSKLNPNFAIGTGSRLHENKVKLVLERLGDSNTQKWYPERCR